MATIIGGIPSTTRFMTSRGKTYVLEPDGSARLATRLENNALSSNLQQFDLYNARGDLVRRGAASTSTVDRVNSPRPTTPSIPPAPASVPVVNYPKPTYNNIVESSLSLPAKIDALRRYLEPGTAPDQMKALMALQTLEGEYGQQVLQAQRPAVTPTTQVSPPQPSPAVTTASIAKPPATTTTPTVSTPSPAPAVQPTTTAVQPVAPTVSTPPSTPTVITTQPQTRPTPVPPAPVPTTPTISTPSPAPAVPPTISAPASTPTTPAPVPTTPAPVNYAMPMTVNIPGLNLGSYWFSGASNPFSWGQMPATPNTGMTALSMPTMPFNWGITR